MHRPAEPIHGTLLLQPLASAWTACIAGIRPPTAGSHRPPLHLEVKAVGEQPTTEIRPPSVGHHDRSGLSQSPLPRGLLEACLLLLLPSRWLDLARRALLEAVMAERTPTIAARRLGEGRHAAAQVGERHSARAAHHRGVRPH